jgi:hypothetical protein
MPGSQSSITVNFWNEGWFEQVFHPLKETLTCKFNDVLG